MAPKTLNRSQITATGILLLLVGVTLSHTLAGQNSFRVVYGLGLQRMPWQTAPYKYAHFKPVSYFSPTFNIALQVDVKSDWAFSAGWSTYKFIVAYQYGTVPVLRHRTTSPA